MPGPDVQVRGHRTTPARLRRRTRCGPKGIRTPDLLAASQALYQLSYGPLSTCGNATTGRDERSVERATHSFGHFDPRLPSTGSASLPFRLRTASRSSHST